MVKKTLLVGGGGGRDLTTYLPRLDCILTVAHSIDCILGTASNRSASWDTYVGDVVVILARDTPLALSITIQPLKQIK